MVASREGRLTPQAYLTSERSAEQRSEFFDGETFAMAGASRAHNRISSNLLVSLGGQLLERSCSIYRSDMKVRIEAVNKYTYPDLVATWGEERFEDDETDVLLNPTVIFEILSDSTEAYDRGLKFQHYQQIPSLLAYLLISQKMSLVEQYQKQPNDTWLYSEQHDMEQLLVIDAILCEVMLSAIYHTVNL